MFLRSGNGDKILSIEVTAVCQRLVTAAIMHCLDACRGDGPRQFITPERF